MVLVYRNEGAVVRESGIPRKELFIITTKVWIQEAGYEKTKKAFEASLSRLGLDTPDLYLIDHGRDACITHRSISGPRRKLHTPMARILPFS